MTGVWRKTDSPVCFVSNQTENDVHCVKVLKHRLTCREISSQAASCGHPVRYFWILVHYHYGCLSVDYRPLHHRVIFPTIQVEVQACVVPREISVTRQRYDANPVSVALRAVEPRAVNHCACVGRLHDLGEVLDSPHTVGAAGFRKADVVDEDAPGGCGGITSHCLESVAELRVDLQRNVSNFPRVVRISCKKK